jgi:hypothetical protein
MSMEHKPEPKTKAAKISEPAQVADTKDTIQETKPIKAEVVPAVVAPVEPLIPFERWFAAQVRSGKYKSHWSAGMRAFTDTSLRKTAAQWTATFESY